MNITSVSSPIYSKIDNSAVDCVIVCEKGTFHFTATSNDVETYGVQLFNDLVTGKYGPIAAYIAP